MPSSSLAGKWIVVTRPSHQSKNFIEKLKEEKANVISFPLLEIEPIENIAKAKKQLEQINQYQLVIFISANAINHCFKIIQVDKFGSLDIAVVGKKTAHQLNSYGMRACCTPQSPYNSEALMALPYLKKLNENDKVAIVRGEGGRDFLKEGLQAQGVQVDYINVYKRSCPQRTLNILTKYHKKNQLDIILLTSVGSVNNLFALQNHKDENAWLNQVEIMAGSNRIRQTIVSNMSHIGKVHVTKDPSDETLYNQLMIWGSQGRENNAD